MGDWHREEPLRMSWSAERREGKLSGRLTAFRSRTRVDSLLTGRADGGGIQGASVGQGGSVGRCVWSVLPLWSMRGSDQVAPVRCCAADPRSISYGICISIFFRFLRACAVYIACACACVDCELWLVHPARGPGDNPDTATHSHAMMWYNAALYVSPCTTLLALLSCTPCTLNSLALLTLPHPIICRRVHGPKASVSQHAHGRMSLFESAKVSACKGSASPSAGGVSVVIVERMAYSVNTPTSGREGGLVPCIRSTA